MKTTAHIFNSIAGGVGRLLSRIGAAAQATEATGLRKYLRVTPTEPQEIVWVRMEDTIEYTVESNVNWNIQ